MRRPPPLREQDEPLTGGNKETAEIGSGKPGPGRPAGTPNKMTRAVREAISRAAELAGNELARLGKEKKGEVGAPEGVDRYLMEAMLADFGVGASLLGRLMGVEAKIKLDDKLDFGALVQLSYEREAARKLAAAERAEAKRKADKVLKVVGSKRSRKAVRA